MATIHDFANRALRVLGVIGAGQEASGNDAADALQKFQDMINDLPGLRKGGWVGVILTDTSDYAAVDGDRVNTAGFAATVTLPDTYVNDLGQTVPTLDLSRVQIIGGAQEGLWIYAAALGAWAQVDALELITQSPFGSEDDAGLVALLAVEMAPEFGEEEATLPQVTAERAARQMRSFRARFRRATSVRVDLSLVIVSDTGHRGLTETLL